MNSGSSATIPVQLSRFHLRRQIAAAVRGVRLWLPLTARAGLVRRLSSNLLLQSIGNLEGRDELFWLRKEAWDQAHQVLGITPSRERFTDTGWEFGLETEVTNALFMPLLASAYRRQHDGRLAAWLDEFVAKRWVDCVRSSLHTRALERTEHSRAADIDRQMRSHVVRSNGHPVLFSLLSSLLADTGFCGKGGVGLIVARPRSLQASHYMPVLERLRSRGISVLWLAVDPGEDGKGVQAFQYPWGLEVSLPPPSPEELLSTSPGARADYGKLLGTVDLGLRRLGGQRGLAASVAHWLPTSVYRWLAASLAAQRVLDALSPRFVHVLPDKDVEARAFVVEARKRGIPRSFHYRSIDLGAPQYWPFTDRTLVSNDARAERLAECLGVPPWRIEPVGDLQVDEVMRDVASLAREKSDQSGSCLLFLTKWPPEVVFGRPEDVLALLHEIDDVGDPLWSYVVRPSPRDGNDYGWLRQTLPGRVRIGGGRYGDSSGLAEALASATLIVTAMGNAAYCAIAAGKPVIVYNPDEKINLGHDRLFARDDLPRHVRLITDRDALVRLLRRVIGGEEQDLLAPGPLKPSLVRYLFHSLDGRTADRIAEALLNNSEVTRQPRQGKR